MDQQEQEAYSHVRGAAANVLFALWDLEHPFREDTLSAHFELAVTLAKAAYLHQRAAATVLQKMGASIDDRELAKLILEAANLEQTCQRMFRRVHQVALKVNEAMQATALPEQGQPLPTGRGPRNPREMFCPLCRQPWPTAPEHTEVEDE
jgi:hypothetical protein